MSNIDKITSNYSVVDQEQLFTELTLEEGAVIEGGFIYDLTNNWSTPVNYNINGVSQSLNPGLSQIYNYPVAPTVSFDSQVGPGYVPVSQALVATPGQNIFDSDGNTITLISTGTPGHPSSNPTPNLVHPIA